MEEEEAGLGALEEEEAGLGASEEEEEEEAAASQGLTLVVAAAVALEAGVCSEATGGAQPDLLLPVLSRTSHEPPVAEFSPQTAAQLLCAPRTSE